MARFVRRNRFGFALPLFFNATSIQDTVVQNLQNTDAANPVYGSGVDGNITLAGSASGTTAITGSGTTYTLTRDLYCRNLTLGTGVHLNTNGNRLFVQSLLNMHTGSRIGYTAGFSTAGSIQQGGAAGQAVSHSLGGNSATQTATNPTTAEGGDIYYQQPLQAFRGYSITAGSPSATFLRGGAGGTTGKGGGVVIICARNITPAGGQCYISAPGDPGSGGGGGGVIIIVSSGPSLPTSVSTNVSGGTGCQSGSVIYMQV